MTIVIVCRPSVVRAIICERCTLNSLLHDYMQLMNHLGIKSRRAASSCKHPLSPLFYGWLGPGAHAHFYLARLLLSLE